MENLINTQWPVVGNWNIETGKCKSQWVIATCFERLVSLGAFLAEFIVPGTEQIVRTSHWYLKISQGGKKNRIMGQLLWAWVPNLPLSVCRRLGAKGGRRRIIRTKGWVIQNIREAQVREQEKGCLWIRVVWEVLWIEGVQVWYHWTNAEAE